MLCRHVFSPPFASRKDLAIVYLTKQLPDSHNRDGYEPDEITPEMVEAAKLALIGWNEGVADFGDGALQVLKAGMLARRK